MNAQDQKKLDAVEQAPQTEAAASADRHQPWICPKCGSKIKFNPNRCSHCGYTKVVEARRIAPHIHKTWYHIALQIMVLLLIGYFAAMFGWMNGLVAELFYGLNPDFLQLAASQPDLFFGTPVFGVIYCLAMVIFLAYTIHTVLTDKESIADRLRVILIITALLAWAPFLYMAIADIVVTSFELRSLTAFDLFDLGLDVIPAIAVTVGCIALIPVNTQLGAVPLNVESDDKQ